jgi:Subtilisin inhibitor-like
MARPVTYRSQMRIAAVALALLVLGASPAATLAASPGETTLTITFFRDGGDPSTRSRWTLTCSPTGGSYPRRVAACALLDRLGTSVFAPVPSDKACTQIFGGSQVAIVTGRVDGRRVWTRFRRDDGCQINRWERAGALLPRTTGVGR